MKKLLFVLAIIFSLFIYRNICTAVTECYFYPNNLIQGSVCGEATPPFITELIFDCYNNPGHATLAVYITVDDCATGCTYNMNGKCNWSGGETCLYPDATATPKLCFSSSRVVVAMEITCDCATPWESNWILYRTGCVNQPCKQGCWGTDWFYRKLYTIGICYD